jgi:cytochrome c1
LLNELGDGPPDGFEVGRLEKGFRLFEPTCVPFVLEEVLSNGLTEDGFEGAPKMLDEEF